MAKTQVKTNELINNDKFKLVEIIGSPFTAIYDKEKQCYFLAIGNKVIYANQFESIEEIQKIIKTKPWDLIINITCMCAEMVYNNLNTNQKSQNHD